LGGKSDESVIYFDESASNEFDAKLDAYAKFSWNKLSYPNYYNYEDVPNLYSITREGKAALSISSLPVNNLVNTIVPLGLRLGTSGNLVISKVDFSAPNTNVYLVDKLENRTVHLNTIETYSFSFTKGDVQDRFELRFNENNAPVAITCLNDRQYAENENFNFDVPENTFVENDLGDNIVSYVATLSDGTQLPSWLSFNQENLSFTGQPGGSDAGVLSVQLGARDIHGAIGTCIFKISIANVNNLPVLANLIPDQEVDQNSAYTYTIPDDIFTDPDLDDNLSLSAKLADGSNLPSWLSFNSQGKRLYGTAQNPGQLNIKITAIDNYGASISDEYVLSVKSTTGIEEMGEDVVIISPNPTKGEFFIEIGKTRQNQKYIIRDFSGKQVKEGLIENKRSPVNLIDYADGIYLIEITDGIESEIFRMILQK
jgi:hypothetical protein